MDRGWIRDGTYPMPLKINFITLLPTRNRNPMRTILIALLIISIGVILKTMQLVAGETIMVCDAGSNENRIYKSKSSILEKSLLNKKLPVNG